MKRRGRKPDEALPASIYRGLHRLGDVEPAKGGTWSAILRSGVVIGTFPTRRDAARAVLEAEA